MNYYAMLWMHIHHITFSIFYSSDANIHLYNSTECQEMEHYGDYCVQHMNLLYGSKVTVENAKAGSITAAF